MAPFDDMSLVKEPHFPVKDYCSFLNLFQKQVEKFKDNIYVWYETVSSQGDIQVKTLTYGQVDLISTNLACELHEKIGKKCVISIIEDHSVYYLILLYTVYKLRVPVQTISTRNSSFAVYSLLNQVNSKCLIYGASYQHIVNAILEENLDIECLLRPNLDLEALSKVALNPSFDQILDQVFTEDDLEKTLIIAHSSGTTNIPKVVSWSNKFLMYYIQSFQHTFYKRKQFEYIEDQNDIVIGITPSCHLFGFYSNFHCILSGGSAYYFQQFPPSPKQVINVINQYNVTRLNAPPYFLNQIMHCMQETGDLQPFQKLKFVVTGGAATPKIIDDLYMKYKINVLNIFALSECINIFSSDVSTERVDTSTFFFLHDAEPHVYLEPFDEERFHLIIKKGSPFLIKGAQYRDNGDYATKDLFIKSKTVKNGYNYSGRADDILVMSNGEKTNPIPMEDMIRSNPLISNCTVIAEGRERAAVLVEINYEIAKEYCLSSILEKVHESVQKANKQAPSHSVILPEMVKIIPISKHLISSDKGTISRKRSIAYFQTEVDSMYPKFIATEYSNKQKASCDIADLTETNDGVLKPTAGSIDKNVSLSNQGLHPLR